ncbi:MAG: bifunctional DNA-formamidopyrimidine glycosylase/DNA-(apurinic or apyrimidinic site) lyase [Actinomycetales bacterium]
MPELPEVEVVRRGLAAHVVGRTIERVRVLHPRAVRRHLPGAQDLEARLAGRTVESAQRRGKYLWLVLAAPDGQPDEAVVAHLGMSGQLLVEAADQPQELHLRVTVAFADGGPQLRFVDQRTFGGFMLEPLVPGDDDGELVPASVAHIARDLLDPRLDLESVVVRLRRRRTGLKRALLDQSLVSGVGNIYADEALWRARLHGGRPTETLTRPEARRVLGFAHEVMSEALSEGGTSFDRLYVDVNGASGYFDRSLAAYGQEGEPCPRCGTPIRREAFMNRSSYSCPKCQPRPRRARW